MREIEEANRYIYEAWRNHPDRFSPTGWVDPHFGARRAEEMLRRCLEDYGMHAVKFNGAQNSYPIDDEALMPLYAQVEHAGAGLAFHIGADAYDFTHPYRAQKVAERFPRMRIRLVHMGVPASPTLARPASAWRRPAQCDAHRQRVSYLAVMEAIRKLGPERVCFGSDAPFALPHVERAAYEAFLPDVVDAAGRELVMGQNALRFFQ